MSLKLQPIEREVWQEFLIATSQGSLFHRWEWQDIIEIGFGVRVNRLGLFDEKGVLKGLLPLAEKKMSLLKLAGSPLSSTATPHGGPIGEVSFAEVLSASRCMLQRNTSITWNFPFTIRWIKRFSKKMGILLRNS